MVTSFFNKLVLVTFFVSTAVFPSQAEISPLIALSSPELLSVSGGSGCDGQNDILHELKTTRSYQTALGLISQLNCDSSKIYGARALQRICGEQRSSANLSNSTLDCPMAAENREWGEYKLKSVSSVSGYVIELASVTPRATLKTNNRSITVKRVQERLSGHGCYKGKSSGIYTDRTKGALKKVSKSYKGNIRPPVSGSPIKAFFQWLLDVKQRNICKPRTRAIASVVPKKGKPVRNRRKSNPDTKKRNSGSSTKFQVKPSKSRKTKKSKPNRTKPIQQVQKAKRKSIKEVPDFDG